MLSDNIWWTRQARIRTERRLLSNAFHSQVILFWYSFYSVAVSIYYLGSPQSEMIGKYWLIYSVLVLVVSSFINGFSYKERASLIKENYEFLKTLSGKAKQLECEKKCTIQVQQEYESALNKCENHLAKDYLEALYDTYHSATDKTKVNSHPTEYQSKQALCNRKIRMLALLFLYCLPFVTTALLNIKYIGQLIMTLLICALR